MTVNDNQGQLTITKTADSSNLSFNNRYISKYCVAVTKLWKDDNDRDGLRPDALYVELLQALKGADGKMGTPVVYQTDIKLSDAAGWTYMVRGVPATDADGNQYVYT